ncbi:MAG: hydrogenase maturation protease [Candidatus Cloacimonetes bacterium]|nr:hydrogenase maturation protease [Candidatus Cloacimonadota bacterium]
MKTLVIGLGNTILSDDGVGIRIAREIEKSCPGTDILEASAAGFRVIDEILGYDRLILIDSIKTGQHQPGKLLRFNWQDFNKTMHHSSPHDISLFEAFELMRRQGQELPDDISIYAVEVVDTFTFSENCTPSVEAVIQTHAEKIIREQSLI